MWPTGNLVIDNQGTVYGTTSFGGQAGDGTVFEYAPGSGLSTLVNFNGLNGRLPTRLAVDGQGNLFGTTLYGRQNGSGTLFEINAAPEPSSVTILGLAGLGLAGLTLKARKRKPVA